MDRVGSLDVASLAVDALADPGCVRMGNDAPGVQLAMILDRATVESALSRVHELEVRAALWAFHDPDYAPWRFDQYAAMERALAAAADVRRCEAV